MIINEWKVIESLGKRWLCECTLCGTVRQVVGYDVRHGKSKNCGCKGKIKLALAAKEKNTKHGRSDKTEQRIWSDMKRRCYDEKRKDYKRYGARGIKVCDRWLFGDGVISGFHCFFNDMGIRPSPDHTLDRIENDLGYSKENCRWANRRQQSYNRRNTFIVKAFGMEITLAEAEDSFGISAPTIYQRIKTHGMSHEEALTRPVRVTKRS